MTRKQLAEKYGISSPIGEYEALKKPGVGKVMLKRLVDAGLVIPINREKAIIRHARAEIDELERKIAALVDLRVSLIDRRDKARERLESLLTPTAATTPHT